MEIVTAVLPVYQWLLTFGHFSFSFFWLQSRLSLVNFHQRKANDGMKTLHSAFDDNIKRVEILQQVVFSLRRLCGEYTKTINRFGQQIEHLDTRLDNFEKKVSVCLVVGFPHFNCSI